jgi:hypothetical protein
MTVHDIHRRFGQDRYAPSELGECQRPVASRTSGNSCVSSEYSAVARLIHEARITAFLWTDEIERGESSPATMQYQIDRLHAAIRDAEA